MTEHKIDKTEHISNIFTLKRGLNGLYIMLFCYWYKCVSVLYVCFALNNTVVKLVDN